MSESYRSKKAYDITTNRVTISTIHSAKGLDYAVVFLLGLDYLTPKGWTEEQIANLTYVGITRARHQLIIPYVNQTSLIDRLNAITN
jgi:superfamily I DNA/RNA helicase